MYHLYPGQSDTISLKYSHAHIHVFFYRLDTFFSCLYTTSQFTISLYTHDCRSVQLIYSIFVDRNSIRHCFKRFNNCHMIQDLKMMIERTFFFVKLSEVQTLEQNGPLKGTTTATAHSSPHKRTEGNWYRKGVFNVTALLLTSHGCLGTACAVRSLNSAEKSFQARLTFSLAIRELWTCVDVDYSSEISISLKVRIPSVKGVAAPGICYTMNTIDV